MTYPRTIGYFRWVAHGDTLAALHRGDVPADHAETCHHNNYSAWFETDERAWLDGLATATKG